MLSYEHRLLRLVSRARVLNRDIGRALSLLPTGNTQAHLSLMNAARAAHANLVALELARETFLDQPSKV